MNGDLLALGVLVALFVGYNIGGATTGPAFGPAVGANVITTAAAAALMSVCFFVVGSTSSSDSPCLRSRRVSSSLRR